MPEFLLRGSVRARRTCRDRVVVDSAGTSAEELGNHADARTPRPSPPATATPTGAAACTGPARSTAPGSTGATSSSPRTAATCVSCSGWRAIDTDIRLIRSFDPAAVSAGTLDVDDPWYGARAFDQTYAELRDAVPGIVAHVRAELGAADRA